jgi:hypothetical protein
MSRTIFNKLVANSDGWSDWQSPIHKGYKLSCCDCGLVHDFEFRIRGKWIEFRCRRNNLSTAGVRRGKKYSARNKRYDDRP